MRNRRLLAVSAALAFLLGMSAPVQSDFPVNAETMVSPRLTVDLNANDGRVASYAHNAENWIIDGETSASKEIGGLTFTLSTEPEGEGNAWLNAFEIDGGDPIQGISRIAPEDEDFHHDLEEGLSWTASMNAVSHDVYLGTDETAVYCRCGGIAEVADCCA